MPDAYELDAVIASVTAHGDVFVGTEKSIKNE
jgi:hypothetical protein